MEIGIALQDLVIICCKVYIHAAHQWYIICVYFTQNVKSSNTLEEVEINKKYFFLKYKIL